MKNNTQNQKQTPKQEESASQKRSNRAIGTSNQALIKKYLTAYLEERPAFFGLIRPQEGVLFHHYSVFAQGNILDFGCGDGFFAELVFGKGKITVGLDIENSRIEEARERGVYTDTVSYDGSVIPFPDNHFDCVISNCVLEHIPTVQKSIDEIYRVLKPGGHFLTGVMTDMWERFMFGPQFFGDYYRSSMRKKQEHYNLFPVEKWDTLFTRPGFTICSRDGYITPRNARWLDIYHYVSLPALVTHGVFGAWVLWRQWHRVIPVAWHMLPIVRESLDAARVEDSSAVFYVLKK